MKKNQYLIKSCWGRRNRTSVNGSQSIETYLLCASITGNEKIRRAATTPFPNIIPHFRWRISHATLPISSNYELDNGLVASVGFY